MKEQPRFLAGLVRFVFVFVRILFSPTSRSETTHATTPAWAHHDAHTDPQRGIHIAFSPRFAYSQHIVSRQDLTVTRTTFTSSPVAPARSPRHSTSIPLSLRLLVHDRPRHGPLDAFVSHESRPLRINEPVVSGLGRQVRFRCRALLEWYGVTCQWTPGQCCRRVQR
jgi:hypothetical protein